MSTTNGIDPRFAPVPVPGPARRPFEPACSEPRPIGEAAEEDLDLRAAWQTLLRHRGMIAKGVALAVGLTLGASLLIRPVYRATSLVEIRPNAEQPVHFEERSASAQTNGRELIETQARIIRSESVIDQVIERLGLADDPELVGLGQNGLVGEATALLRSLRGQRSPDPTLRDADLWRNFRERLSTSLVRESNLIEVRFESVSPQRAAEIVDAVVEEYVRLNESQWSRAGSNAKRYLEDEIARAAEKLRRSELELNDFARRHDIVDVEEGADLLNMRVTELSTELTVAIQRRVQAEALARQVQDGRVEELGVVLQSELVGHLKEEQARLTAEYERLGRIYRAGYPKLQQLSAQIEEVRANRDREVRRLLAGVGAEHEGARNRESLLKQELEKEKAALLDLKDRAVEYHILKREWEASRELHAGLLEQMKRTGVMAGIGPSIAVLIDAARTPEKPQRPRPFLYAAAAGLLSLLLGTALAFLRAHLDDVVRTAEDLEALTGLVSLAQVPKHQPALLAGERIECLPHTQQRSGVAQALRSLRTNLAASFPPGGPRLIQVTSSWQAEGKTTTAINLAVVIAQRGSRVLLVDAEMRRPRVHTVFSVPQRPGLAEILAGDGSVRPHESFVPKLSILPAGAARGDPADLLGSLNLAVFFENARSAFDYVIVDSPPVLGLADSTLLGSRVEGVLLVAGAGSSRRGAVVEAARRMRLVHSPLIGTVLNRADAHADPYGYYDYEATDPDAEGAAGSSPAGDSRCVEYPH